MKNKLNDLQSHEIETPYQAALRVVAATEPEQALRIEQALKEGRITLQDVIGFNKIRAVVQ